MTEPTPQPKGRRWGAAALIAVLAAAIIVFVVIGVVSAATAPHPAGSSTPIAAAPSATTAATTVPTSTPSASPTKATSTKKPSKQPTAVPVPAAKPQPTKTATISKPTVIVKALTAKVTKMEAVTGKADGPGEIGGPSVRFTITISNSTGKTVALSNTVVNAYYGKSSTPAVELRMPGGVNFPASVKNGRSATGVFIFNIPKASRSLVQVTVDTSVKNPVVAFKGAAPQ